MGLGRSEIGVDYIPCFLATAVADVSTFVGSCSHEYAIQGAMCFASVVVLTAGLVAYVQTKNSIKRGEYCITYLDDVYSG